MDPGYVALALVCGTLVGLALGTVGGGGSILTVPILIYALGEGVHRATGAALAIVGVNALIAAWPHARAVRVRLPVALTVGAMGIVGAVAGTWLGGLAPARAILIGFAALMLVAAVAMVRLRPPLRLGAAPPVGFSPRVAAVGLAVGVLTGFFGVGGGFLIVPALVLALGLPMREAVGASLAVIAINAAALTGRLSAGGVDLAVTVLFIVGGALGSALGGRLADRLSERRLRQGSPGWSCSLPCTS